MGLRSAFKRWRDARRTGPAAQQQPTGGQADAQQNPQHAAADQSRFISVVANLVVPKSKTSWAFIIMLLVFLLVAWWKNIFGLRTVLLTFGVTISGIIAVGIILIFIAYGFATCKNDPSKFYIAAALLLWIIDLIPQNFFLIGPYLGPEWAGFIWPLGGIWHIPWASIFLSSFFFSLLYINMVFNIIEKEYIGFGLGFLFILITNYLITRFFPNYISFGFNLYIPHGYTILFNVGVIALLVVLGYAAWRLDRHRRGTAVPEFFSSVYMIFVFSFFWMNNGWQSNLRAILHLIFIFGFGFSYMRTAKAGSSIEWKIWMPTLLIIDFFGYGFLWASDILILKFIPPVALFVIIYCYEKETVSGRRNYTYPVAAVILLVTFFLIMSLKVAGFEEGNLPYVAAQGSTFKDIYTQFTTNIKNVVEGRLDVATGGLFKGIVEKNQYESLGVYFANVKPADPRFYNDEPVTVWGTIRSKTYQEPVIVNFKCFRWKDNKRIPAEKYVPGTFPVFQLEESDVECIFQQKEGSKLDLGYNTIIFSAEYNFATNAYQKAYFIDRERYRAMVRENLDPFTEFGIKDKKPASVSTNGPVEIGINIQPLTGVSKVYQVLPTLGVSLFNRKEIQDKDKRLITKWEGKINKVTELIILTPPGVTIPNLNELCVGDKFKEGKCPCNRPFKDYKVDDCTASCTKQVKEPCDKACTTYELTGTSKTDEKCIKECESTTNRCNDECTFLFTPDPGEGTADQKYNAYALDVEAITYRDEYKDIDKFKTFLCRIETDPDKVLGNSPITTRYFRVRARYNYSLESSVKITVEQAPVLAMPERTGEFNQEKLPEQRYQEAYFNTQGTALSNEIRYSPIVFEIAKKYDVDYLFVKSIIQHESNWNPGAKGDGKLGTPVSYGFMQVAEGEKKGCPSNYNTDPRANIECGIRHIRYLMDLQKKENLKSGLDNVAAGYNCGEIGMKYSKDKGYEHVAVWENPANCWSKDRSTNTREYVKRVITIYNTLLQRARTTTTVTAP